MGYEQAYILFITYILSDVGQPISYFSLLLYIGYYRLTYILLITYITKVIS